MTAEGRRRQFLRVEVSDSGAASPRISSRNCLRRSSPPSRPERDWASCCASGLSRFMAAGCGPSAAASIAPNGAKSSREGMTFKVTLPMMPPEKHPH